MLTQRRRLRERLGRVHHEHDQRSQVLRAGPTGDRDLLIEAHHALWSTLFARGEVVVLGEHTAQGRALYDRERHAPLAAVYGNHDRAVCALGHGAWALEFRGEPEQASPQSTDAVARAPFRISTRR